MGNMNLLMEGVHIAHDAIIGNRCIIGNTTKIAGEVTVDDNAVISACVLIHQFCHVGGYIMLGGGTRTGQDIPPYVTVAREPAQYCGLNLVGLRRHGFTAEQIEVIHEAYRIIYDRSISLEERIAKVRSQFPNSPEVDYITRFVESSKRGII